ncbi:MAG: hypothetical protein ABIM74_06725 [candidate division WOR-3 bacterium]
MIKTGRAGERIRWGDLDIEFLRDGDGWRAIGSVNCLLPFDPVGRDVLIAPILPKERYYLDVEPPVIIAPGSSVALTAVFPVGVEVFLGDLKIGDHNPRLKRTYLGPTTGGAFAVYVRSGEIYQPGLLVDVSVVNHEKETLCFDELTLAPWLLSVFEHDGEWVSERLIVHLGHDEIDVKHTDQGPGELIIRGRRESEINKRLKKFVQRLKDVI